MSNLLVNKAYAVPRSELDGVAKSVLVNLCDRADDKGDNLRMSVSSVAAETGWRRMTAQAALQRLERHSRKFLLRRGNGRKGVVLYAINTAALVWDRWKSPEGPARETSTCSPDEHQPARETSSNVLATRSQTVLEPVLNHATTRCARNGERFEEFWKAYPRKVSKDAARRAFDKRRVDDELLRQMLTALERQQTSPGWQKDGGQFIPHPATWLNAGRWQDEISDANRAPAAKSTALVKMCKRCDRRNALFEGLCADCWRIVNAA